MFDFHEKRKLRSLFYSKPVSVILFAFAILLSFSAYNRYSVAGDMKEKLEAKRAELQKLEERAQSLETKVEYLENERGVEEEIRNRFDVAKEGEQVVILIDPKKEGETEASKTAAGNSGMQQDGEIEQSFWDFFKFW